VHKLWSPAGLPLPDCIGTCSDHIHVIASGAKQSRGIELADRNCLNHQIAGHRDQFYPLTLALSRQGRENLGAGTSPAPTE
jgi:hypothetical protein